MNDKTLTPQDELEILHSERKLSLGGQVITVREFSFTEGMRAVVIAQGLLQEMVVLFRDSEEVDLGALELLFAQHMDALGELMAMATDTDPLWISRLSDEEGQQLYLTFWEVNRGFFTRRITMQVMSDHQAQQLAQGSQNSTPP